MRNKNLQNMFNLIDDDILEDADPTRKKKKAFSSKYVWMQIATIAACLILTLNMVITIPLMLNKDEGDDSIDPPSTGVIDNSQSTPNGNTDNSTQNDDKAETPDAEDKGENIIIEHIQNVTNIHVNVAGKPTNVISLSSPLLGAPSEYDEIVKAMQQIADGRLGSSLNKNEEAIGDHSDKLNQDMKEEESDAIEDSEINSALDSNYHETTDLQVEGVIEGDIIKRSDEYIYYLSGSELRVYSIGFNPELVALYSIEDYVTTIREAMELPLPDTKLEILERETPSLNEMFLSPDCKTVTIVYDDYVDVYSYLVLNGKEVANRIIVDDDGLCYTAMITLNVEDAENIYLDGITTLFGEYKSARYVDGEYLVFTKYTPRAYDLIIPQYNDGDGFELFPVDKIEQPDVYSCEDYLLAYRLDSSCEITEMGAYASFSGHIYVSGDNIYLTREYWEDLREEAPEDEILKDEKIELPSLEETSKLYLVENMVTEIMKIGYKDGEFDVVGTVKLDGYLKDRYSISENGDYLYVVTTENNKYSFSKYKSEDFVADIISGARNASLFVVDAESMELVSLAKRFAPDGEIVRAVKFDGYYAYVCTAVEVTDPVFFFNLEDPYDIKYSNTGTIPGFSTSLIDFGNGNLLGIGEDENGDTKIEVYREGENDTVEIVATYIFNGSYSTDYKSYYINREYGLFGFGLLDYSNIDASRYVVLQFKNNELSLVFNRTLRGINNTKRAVFIDSNFYLFSDKDFTSFKVRVSKP